MCNLFSPWTVECKNNSYIYLKKSVWTEIRNIQWWKRSMIGNRIRKYLQLNFFMNYFCMYIAKIFFSENLIISPYDCLLGATLPDNRHSSMLHGDAFGTSDFAKSNPPIIWRPKDHGRWSLQGRHKNYQHLWRCRPSEQRITSVQRDPILRILATSMAASCGSP